MMLITHLKTHYSISTAPNQPLRGVDEAHISLFSDHIHSRKHWIPRKQLKADWQR